MVCLCKHRELSSEQTLPGGASAGLVLSLDTEFDLQPLSPSLPFPSHSPHDWHGLLRQSGTPSAEAPAAVAAPAAEAAQEGQGERCH